MFPLKKPGQLQEQEIFKIIDAQNIYDKLDLKSINQENFLNIEVDAYENVKVKLFVFILKLYLEYIYNSEPIKNKLKIMLNLQQQLTNAIQEQKSSKKSELQLIMIDILQKILKEILIRAFYKFKLMKNSANITEDNMKKLQMQYHEHIQSFTTKNDNYQQLNKHLSDLVSLFPNDNLLMIQFQKQINQINTIIQNPQRTQIDPNCIFVPENNPNSIKCEKTTQELQNEQQQYIQYQSQQQQQALQQQQILQQQNQQNLLAKVPISQKQQQQQNMDDLGVAKANYDQYSSKQLQQSIAQNQNAQQQQQSKLQFQPLQQQSQQYPYQQSSQQQQQLQQQQQQQLQQQQQVQKQQQQQLQYQQQQTPQQQQQQSHQMTARVSQNKCLFPGEKVEQLQLLMNIRDFTQNQINEIMAMEQYQKDGIVFEQIENYNVQGYIYIQMRLSDINIREFQTIIVRILKYQDNGKGIFELIDCHKYADFLKQYLHQENKFAKFDLMLIAYKQFVEHMSQKQIEEKKEENYKQILRYLKSPYNFENQKNLSSLIEENKHPVSIINLIKNTITQFKQNHQATSMNIVYQKNDTEIIITIKQQYILMVKINNSENRQQGHSQLAFTQSTPIEQSTQFSQECKSLLEELKKEIISCYNK